MANATFAPGLMPTHRTDHTDINELHVAHAHVHEGALPRSTWALLTNADIWHRESGCQSRQRLFRVFMDLGYKKHVNSAGGKKCRGS